MLSRPQRTLAAAAPRRGTPGRVLGRLGASIPRPLAVAVLLAVAACAPALATAQEERGEACATIVSTNDLHGHLRPATPPWAEGDTVGGVAVLAGYFDRVREESPDDCPVFVLDGGDVMQGTPISNLVDGESTIAAMNELGYDAAALGNHEFDWGIETLRRRMAQAEFPFLAANVTEAATGRRPEWLLPWTVLERDGVRVGVVGLATPSTPQTTRPANVADLRFGSMARALDRSIPEVRAEGVDFVVVVMHSGAFCGAAGCEGEAIDALEATTEPFDYAVAGHTHSRVETRVRGAPVVQSFSNGLAFGLGRLERDDDGAVTARLLEIRNTYAGAVEPDSDLARLVDRYWERVRAEVNEVVATLAEPMPRQGAHGEYGLGRLIADAQRRATGTQVSIMNNGGIRIGLPAGRATYGELFEVQPFQNVLTRLEVTGATLLATLEHAIEEDGEVDAHVSGVEVRYDPDAPEGRRILEARLTDDADWTAGAGGTGARGGPDADPGDAGASGERDGGAGDGEAGPVIHPDSVYTLTANDFMATGGSGYSMLDDALSAELTGIVDLEALIAHLRRLPSPVRPPPEPRWHPVESP